MVHCAVEWGLYKEAKERYNYVPPSLPVLGSLAISGITECPLTTDKSYFWREDVQLSLFWMTLKCCPEHACVCARELIHSYISPSPPYTIPTPLHNVPALLVEWEIVPNRFLGELRPYRAKYLFNSVITYGALVSCTSQYPVK